MQIADGLVVTIEYTLTEADGTLVESSKDRGPVTFKQGSDRMLPGIANAIEGMEVGESRSGVIPPGELFPRTQTRTRTMGLTEFPDGLDPKVDDRFQAKGEDGQPVLFEVIERTDDSVTVQLLHILHDQEVHYEVTVLAARKANLPPPAPVDVPDFTEDLELSEEE
jgi:FKBP-type peptidyl-prolyl cis-trans isomerase SlyD